MSSLKTNDKQILEKLFQMNGGYVLNFYNRTMEEFFKDTLGVDIYSEKTYWKSEGKDFWDIDQEEKSNTVSIKKKIYKVLKKDGLSDNKIAQAMNVSEYKIKKIKHDI